MDTPVIFHLGPLPISRTVVTTWALLVALGLTGFLGTRRMTDTPGPWQSALEGIVCAIDDAVRSMLPESPAGLADWIGTLWIFLVAANLTGIVPGLSSPTDDLSLTTALALLVFLSVHAFGIRSAGLWAHLRHYAQPSLILLPFHIIGELTRTVSLAMRLFGNIMSLEIAALLVLLVGGLLVPVPLLLLHIVEALVQAYIFGMLALVYIAGAIQSRRTAASAIP
ncbi:F0F1 ATP synthase subunit A [Fontimonas sp. SYSU GA230001]|uniref:F0F1 ATP synthase subunit A n=1 Tax=Fontimonas sp. SYSU GA230001 TaxID=3142450 RepID=UPI0032B39233